MKQNAQSQHLISTYAVNVLVAHLQSHHLPYTQVISDVDDTRRQNRWHSTRDRRQTIPSLGDLCDATNLITIIANVRPTKIYNLGAMSHVKVSFDMPEYTADCDGVGVLRMLDAVRACGLEKDVKFYQASTSELYGKVREVSESETTPFYPRSPYAVAKKYAYW